jgi:hypothetical protein
MLLRATRGSCSASLQKSRVTIFLSVTLGREAVPRSGYAGFGLGFPESFGGAAHQVPTAYRGVLPKFCFGGLVKVPILWGCYGGIL